MSFTSECAFCFFPCGVYIGHHTWEDEPACDMQTAVLTGKNESKRRKMQISTLTGPENIANDLPQNLTANVKFKGRVVILGNYLTKTNFSLLFNFACLLFALKCSHFPGRQRQNENYESFNLPLHGCQRGGYFMACC